MGNGVGRPQPHPLGGVVVGRIAEGFLEAPVDHVQVDANGGQQLGVAGLGAREHALADQAVEAGPDGLQVQTVCAQHSGRQAVPLGEEAQEQVLGTEVVLVAALGLLPVA
jgi:hypothetical protein